MLSILASAILLQTPEAGKLFVPAHSGYAKGIGIEYRDASLSVFPTSADRNWDSSKPRQQPLRTVTWLGYLNAGELNFALKFSSTTSFGMAFSVTKAETPRAGRFGVGSSSSKERKYVIPMAGYYKLEFQLEPVYLPTHLKGLELSGPATIGAKFNLKERRNAPSVHLTYPLPPEEKVEWFYNEIRPQTDHPATYYQACGFHRGYFGIQVNSPTERRVIFSVWDSGDVPDDRAKVKKEDLVQCLEKGNDVVAEGFGNEGTGGHSHLVYNWKTKDVHRFLVHAQPDGDKTIYTGYYWFNETKKWGLIAKFRAPKDGSYMKGLYSFNENFWGDNGDQLFSARFGPGWVRRPDGWWRDLTNATFSCDKTGREDRFDYSAGTKDGLFFLTNGGAVANGVKYGDPLVRPASKLGPPKDLPTE